MDSPTLADRLREVVGTGRPRLAPAVLPAAADTDLRLVLGGSWRLCHESSCFVVERKQEPSTRHGRDTVGTIAYKLADGSAEVALLTGGGAAGPPFLFFDLETTGLSGGAGTHAFLVGCGWFDADGAFLTRQFLLTRYADERELLAAVAGEMALAGALVSFNGKSFDAPVLETRYLFHRLEWMGASLPHIDVLHPARRFWGSSARESCSLTALERDILDARRVDDVPGFEIPGRYFQFVRSGDARPLVDVLEHNRLDLLSLAGLTARLLDLVRLGPDAARDASEALALGEVYARAGLQERAHEAYTISVEASVSLPVVRISALRGLALLLRRARQYDEAAACWRELIALRGCPKPVVREASEALAIHHEHRVRDLAVAKAFALRTLEGGERGRWVEAARHRLARIQKKMGKSEVSSLKFEGESRQT
ncbi:MAG: ribonuclease H-like domain-containing protein [Vicinamibacterales bacterium]